MRLLQVMAGAEHGGAEAFFYRLIPALSQRGIEQLVVMRPHQKAVASLRDEGIEVETAPFKRAFDFRTPKMLRRCFEAFKPDVVMTWMSRASSLCPKPPKEALFVSRLGGYYDLKYYQKADYLIGNTKDIQNYFIKESWPKEKTSYLPNFVDEPNASPALKRSTYETPEDAPLVLTLGRLHDDKAFDVLIKALAQVPKAYLWIGGVGPREDFLKNLTKQQGVENRVRFLGWQEDVSALYKVCDIYCCPSRIEPLGNVVIEGWAHQKPVVAARSSGPEGLIQDGKDGLLAPLEDTETLANHLNSLIQDQALRTSIAQKGRQTFEAYFTQEKVVDQYLSFFDTILSSKKQESLCAG